MAGAIAIIILAMLIGFIPGYIWGKSDREDKKNKAAEQKPAEPIIERKEYNLRTYHEEMHLDKPIGTTHRREQANIARVLYYRIFDKMCEEGAGEIRVFEDPDIYSFNRQKVGLTITVVEGNNEKRI